MAERIRIKDIAELAGVSVGTVDRILHNRPNVSKTAREKVEKVMEEIKYQPNMYASALAYNKRLKFWCIIPRHDQEAYWEEIEEGVMRAQRERQEFNVTVELHYYQRYHETSFDLITEECLKAQPDGVIIVPSDLEPTRKLTDALHEREVPFVMLDSYMPDLKPLSFYGQDSFASGFFAARFLMLLAHDEKEIAIVKMVKNGLMSSKQQRNREVGFRHYMSDHFPSVAISELQLPAEMLRKEYDKLMEDFYAEHPHVHHSIMFSSKAHIVGDWLLRTNKRNMQIMGYDMVGKNAECLRNGSISFLIAQHAYMQGYSSVMALFDDIVLHKVVTPVNYMPIEIISPENVNFYRRQQL